MESFYCCSCVLELITGNISGLRSVFQMFCFQAALRPYSCLFRLAGFLLLPSRQFPHSVEVFCTWLLYFLVSVLYTRCRLGYPSKTWFLFCTGIMSWVLETVDGCEGCGFFKLLHGRRNQYFVGRPRTSAFQHTCVQIQSLWNMMKSLVVFWLLK